VASGRSVILTSEPLPFASLALLTASPPAGSVESDGAGSRDRQADIVAVTRRLLEVSAARDR
jgi:hypothetical protein